MDNTLILNERVSVLALYKADSNDRTICYPVKMKHNNREIRFTELGLRHTASKGRRMIHVFDMTDGTADYRLEFDAKSLIWTLVYIADEHHEV